MDVTLNYRRSGILHNLLALAGMGLCFAEPGSNSTDAEQVATRWFNEGAVTMKAAKTENEFATARACFEKAADLGHGEAKGALGYLLQTGQGGEKNLERAETLLKAASDAGVHSAAYNLGVILEKHDPKEAIRYFEKAAAGKNHAAIVKLADAHYFGKLGLEPDYTKALPYVSTAASAGDARMQNILGTMFDYSQGLEGNKASAMAWYEKAARQGHAKAQANFGRALIAFHHTNPDPIEPYVWLKLASDQGESSASITLKDFVLSMSQNEIEQGNRKSLTINKEIEKLHRKGRKPTSENHK